MAETIPELRLEESVRNPAEYFDLFVSTGWNREYQLTETEMTRAVLKSWYLVTAYRRDKLVGTGRIISDGVCHALILDVIVSPEHQHQGIGTVIMHRLLERCRENNIRDVQLFCARGKTDFYQKLGFVPRPEDAPGMDFSVPHPRVE